MLDLLPFVREPAVVPVRETTAELAYLAAVSFACLRDALQAAVPYFEKRRKLQSRCGVPELFYFDQARDAELQRLGGPLNEAPRKAAAAEPSAFRASQRLPDLLDDVLSLTHHGPDLRSVLRATSHLPESVETWAGEHPKLARLDRVAKLTDHDVIRLIHPLHRTGRRIRVNGLDTLRQLHELFAEMSNDAVPADFTKDGEPRVTARLQLVRPQALVRTGSIEGWAAVNHWLWGQESPRTLPRLDGDLLVLTAEPTLKMKWIAEQSSTGIRAEATLLDEMTTTEVTDFLQMWTGRIEAPKLRRAA